MRNLFDLKHKVLLPALISLIILFPGLVGAEVHRTVLPNGLTVLIQENHVLPIVTTIIFYKVGLRDESSGKTGKVHFVEHLMFKGTDKYAKGEISRLIKSLGGDVSAFTTADYTAFTSVLPAKYLELALAIEANRMRNCTFVTQEVEAERKVIMEERKMDMDSPYDNLGEEIMKRAFKRHAYRYPILGYLNNTAGFTRKELVDFYNLYYQPNNAIIVITGDVKYGSALKLVSGLFGKIPRKEDPPRIKIFEPERTIETRFVIRREVSLPAIEIAYPAPRYGTKDSYALEVLDHILTQGKNPRLYKKLVRENGFFNGVTSTFYRRIDPYIFIIAAEVKPGVNRQKAERALIDAVEGLKERPPSDNEIVKAKNRLVAGLISQQEFIDKQAEWIGKTEIFGGGVDVQKYAQEILSISKEDLRRAVKKYFVKEKRIVGWLLPRSR